MMDKILIGGCALLPLLAQAATSGPGPGAAQMASDVCAARVRSVALVDAALARADAVARLNAFTTVDAAGARQAAARLDASDARRRCGPLAGVPIVVKDNIDVAGLPTTAGTPALLKNVPRADAPVVERLRRAGAIVLAKTNMHELAFGISGWNETFQSGPAPGVRNAWSTDHMAGGSSSGSGAAVGAQVVAIALGTDTGGSVRIPCAFNGCASLRPTVGRYPSGGIVPISRTRDTAGPMAASMVDLELVDRVISGAGRTAPARLDGLRLGRVPALLEHLDDDTRVAYLSTLAKLQAAGVQIIDVPLPGLQQLNGQVGFPLALYEAYDDMQRYLRQSGSGVTIDQLAAAIRSPDVKATYQGLVLPRKLPGPNNSVVDAKPAYDAAMATARPALQALYREGFRRHRVDALIFPTVPKVAMAAEPGASSLANFLATIQNTDPGSNAGLPGLQLPMGLGLSSGLPVGLELDGPPGSDRRLIAIGLAIEAVVGRLPAPPR